MEPITVLPAILTGYGYQWWRHSFKVERKTIEAPAAIGWGGQYIFLSPALGMVVVFTAGDYLMPRTFIDMGAQII